MGLPFSPRPYWTYPTVRQALNFYIKYSLVFSYFIIFLVKRHWGVTSPSPPLSAGWPVVTKPQKWWPQRKRWVLSTRSRLHALVWAPSSRGGVNHQALLASILALRINAVFANLLLAKINLPCHFKYLICRRYTVYLTWGDVVVTVMLTLPQQCG